MAAAGDEQSTPQRIWYRVLLIGTCLVWMMAGLFDREPWKADEAYSIGIVYSTVTHGQWLVPTLGGEPFLEKPPLVYWLGAIAVHLLSPVLPLHVAARVANVICALLTFWLLFLAQRQALGRLAARHAVLLLAACPAWLFASRYLTADLGQMPAAALVMLGLVRFQQQRRNAGLLIGLGGGLGLMAKGLLLPGVTGVSFLVMMAARSSLCNRWGAGQALQALIAFIVAGLSWPVLLGLHSRELLWTWLWENNFGRFLGSNDLGPPNSRWSILGALAGMLLPAWPLAVAYLRQRRGSLRADHLFGPAVFTFVWLLVMLLSSTSRGVYGIPLLVPLSLLGAGALQPGAAWQMPEAVRRGGRMTVCLLALIGLAVIAAAMADQLPRRFGPSSPGLLALAGALALVWLVAIWQGVRPGVLLASVTTLTLVFTLALAVLLPRIDLRTGYREVFTHMRAYLPASQGCASSHRLGESERGMLEYYTGLVTRRVEADPQAWSCPLHVEQERDSERAEGFGCTGMTILWEGWRAEHEEEVFRLCAKRE